MLYDELILHQSTRLITFKILKFYFLNAGYKLMMDMQLTPFWLLTSFSIDSPFIDNLNDFLLSLRDNQPSA